ncbi:MAG: hypothetical protein AAB586_01915 [Patescibacteria group bacterium]
MQISATKNLKYGLTLVEVIMATSIILVFLLALFGTHNLYLKTAFSNGEVVKATALAEEGLEAVRFLRDSSWNTNIEPLFINTDYYLVFDGDGWQITTAHAFIDNRFERKIMFSSVYRDVSGGIVASGGTLDPDTRMVVSSVSWLQANATTTKSISTYIANIFDN